MAFRFCGGWRGVYHGHDELRTYLGDLEDALGDESRVGPEAYFDLGEQTLVVYVVHVRGKQSGAEVVTPAAAVARWRDGLITLHKAYRSKEEALKDLGVSEDVLVPIAP